MTAYRDDLEAAQLRADALEREVAELRERNQRLEAGHARADTSDATTNAQRLAAAVAREQEEQRLREEADLDEREARERGKSESRSRYSASPRHRESQDDRGGIPAIAAYGLALVFGGLAQYSVGAGLAAVILCGAGLGFYAYGKRGASDKGNQ